ncbi:MAG TPA: sigma-70 family RNA polymerase sigma factor [Chitinivibrionales bacterium]|nr:sigma-70 family RNA polymerase sigma factor [Chitinivibrionales bacterium]
MQIHLTDDASLVARCVAQPPDKGALNELISRYGRLVMQTITWVFRRYSAKDQDEIKDVFQEVFVSLFDGDCRKLKAYVPEKAGLGTYLMTIARTTAINALNRRRKGPVEPPENVIDEEEGFLPLENGEIMEKIKGLLVDFSPQERLFYHLYFEECMPPETIATVMGVAVDTIYSKKAKIVQKIKKGMRRVVAK